jgi:hypothetical protein
MYYMIHGVELIVRRPTTQSVIMWYLLSWETGLRREGLDLSIGPN